MRDKIMMKSTGKTKAGKPTGTYRTTTINKKKTTEKLELSSYDRRAHNPKTGKLGMHVKFVQHKLPSSSK